MKKRKTKENEVIIQCKIGLVSFSKNNSCVAFLGEVFNKNTRQNIDLLYQIYHDCIYLSKFRIFQEKNYFLPDTLKDIQEFQNIYKLTRKISFKGNIKNRMIFSRPQLYDINCMVPLFSNKISVPRYVQNNGTTVPILISPNLNCVERGKILDGVFNTFFNNQLLFYMLNGADSTLYRYLIFRGVDKKNIQIQQKYPESIIDVALYLSQNFNLVTIYLVLSTDEIADISMYIRRVYSEKNHSFQTIPINFLCD